MNQKLILRLSLVALIFAFLSLSNVRNARLYSTAPQIDTVTLTSGIAQTGSIPAPERDGCLLAQTQYTIFYPGRPAKLRVDVSADRDVDLYVRFGQRVAASPTGIVANARSLSDLNSESIAFPRSQSEVPEPGTYFIAVANCGTEPASFVIKATIIDESDADTVDLSFIMPISGTAQAPVPNACILSQVQFRIRLDGRVPCGGADLGLIVSNVPGLKLYARFGQRVALEDGRIAADLESETLESGEFLRITPVNAGGLFYIAVNNCSFEDKSFNLGAIIAEGDAAFPLIFRASIRGKKLLVEGGGFRLGSVILVDGVPQKTNPDENAPAQLLIGGKAGKYIKRFGSFFVEVVSAKGCRSSRLIFPRQPKD